MALFSNIETTELSSAGVLLNKTSGFIAASPNVALTLVVFPFRTKECVLALLYASPEK